MEVPPLRSFLIVITFLGTFTLLVASMPIELIVSPSERREYEVEEYFEAIDLQSFAEIFQYCMNETGGTSYPLLYAKSVDIGGRDLTLYYKKANQSDLYLYLVHKWTEWIIIPCLHYQIWINSEGVTRSAGAQKQNRIYDYTINQDYSDSLPYTAKCSHFQVTVYFGYNETTYSSVTEAWNHHALYILIGIDFAEMATGMNAWNLIAMLLFFQMPDIHPVLNMILALPIWVCIAWLAVAFIIAFIKSLPFT